MMTDLEIATWARTTDAALPSRERTPYILAVAESPYEAAAAIGRLAAEVQQLRAALTALRAVGKVGLP